MPIPLHILKSVLHFTASRVIVPNAYIELCKIYLQEKMQNIGLYNMILGPCNSDYSYILLCISNYTLFVCKCKVYKYLDSNLLNITMNI